MRHFIAVVVLALLSACGQAQSTSESADVDQRPAWQIALTDAPQVFRPYSPARGLSPLEGGTVTPADGDAATISTPPVHGAWAAMLTTGPDGDSLGTALRIRAKVDSGAFVFASTYAGADPSAVSASETVPAGAETIVYVPLDRRGNPALIIANGASGEPSSGTVLEISLVGPP